MPALLDAAAASGGRLGVVGGAVGLLVSEDVTKSGSRRPATRYRSSKHCVRPTPPPTGSPSSPPAIYCSFVPGEHTGTYRIGGDVLLTDPDGKSTIGGEDFAAAILDELDRQAHHRQLFTVAY